MYASINHPTNISAPSPPPPPKNWNHINSSRTPWQPPPQNWYKLNCDGSYSNLRIGIGGCLRDSSRNWIRGFSQFFGEGDTLTAKLKAISTGLNLLLLDIQQRSKIAIETDSITAINLIMYNFSNQHPMRNILQLCRHSLTREVENKTNVLTNLPEIEERNVCLSLSMMESQIMCYHYKMKSNLHNSLAFLCILAHSCCNYLQQSRNFIFYLLCLCLLFGLNVMRILYLYLAPPLFS